MSDIDHIISNKRKGSFKRVWRSTGPTLGAVLLFFLLALWTGYNMVESQRNIDRTALAARIDACERGNLIRASQRESNAILIRLLNTAITNQTPELASARAKLESHYRANPQDPVAAFALEVTRNSSMNLSTIQRAKGSLKRQVRELAPVDCESVEDRVSD